MLQRVSPLNGFRMTKSFTRAMETFLKYIRIDIYDVSDDNELNSLVISLFVRTSCMDLEI